MVTQQDSQTNVKIAKAVKEDSVAMRFLAIINMLFLPAMFSAECFK